MVDDLASPIAPLHTLSIAASMRVGGSCAPLLRARSIASPRSPRRTGGCSLSSVFIRDCLARRARGVLTSRRASLPAQPPAASMRVGLPIPSHPINRIASRLQRGRAATAFHQQRRMEPRTKEALGACRLPPPAAVGGLCITPPYAVQGRRDVMEWDRTRHRRVDDPEMSREDARGPFRWTLPPGYRRTGGSG